MILAVVAGSAARAWADTYGYMAGARGVDDPGSRTGGRCGLCSEERRRGMPGVRELVSASSTERQNFLRERTTENKKSKTGLHGGGSGVAADAGSGARQLRKKRRRSGERHSGNECGRSGAESSGLVIKAQSGPPRRQIGTWRRVGLEASEVERPIVRWASACNGTRCGRRSDTCCDVAACGGRQNTRARQPDQIQRGDLWLHNRG